MFLVTKKIKDRVYEVFDTDDESTDECSLKELFEFHRLGIEIDGVTFNGNKISILAIVITDVI